MQRDLYACRAETNQLIEHVNRLGALSLENQTKLAARNIEMQEKLDMFESWMDIPTGNGTRVASAVTPAIVFELKKLPQVAISN